jgi:methionyl-tRNA formyltransferase
MEPFAAEPVRIVYFGTPAYAVPALAALDSDERVDVVLVVTQPDRPVGRGRTLTPPPVKSEAELRNLPIYQPESLRTEVDRERIAAVGAHLFVVAAYGKIFGPKLLALPPMGSVNLHASILPDYRGASPISAAILEGNFRTGVTLMGMDVGLDTGPILTQRSIDIEPGDTTASLTPKLAQVGAELLIDSLDALLNGSLRPESQDDRIASVTRPMVKADGWIDWSRPAVEIERQVRAMWDWPRAWTTIDGESLQLHRATVIDRTLGEPGSVTMSGEEAVVSTGEGGLVVELAQAAGGRPLAGRLVLGRAIREHVILGKSGTPEPAAIPLVRTAEP